MWQRFTKTQRLVADIFTELDKNYVCHTNVKSIWDLSVATLRRELDECEEVENKIHQFLVKLVKCEREGKAIPNEVFSSLCEMLLQTETYFKFETLLCKESSQYFHMEGNKCVTSMSTAGYLTHVGQRLRNERERCTELFQSNSEKEIVEIVLKEMVIEFHQQILGDGLSALLESRDFESLQQLYRLCLLTDLVEPLRINFREWAKKAGCERMKIGPDLVPTLMEFQAFVDRVVQCTFEKNIQFKLTTERIWSAVMNKIPNTPSINLAEYIDKRLRQGPEGDASTFKDEMNRCVRLFQYIRGQDVFVMWYSRYLAKRLLLKKYSSEYEEKEMIQRLEQVCGKDSSKKLLAMFEDMQVSSQIAKEYRGIFPLKKDKTNWECQILDASTWPHNTDDYKLKLPEVVSSQIQSFDKWYVGSKFSGRKLQWIHSFSHCAILAKFPSGAKELIVSAQQGAILLCFNNNEKISYEELSGQTGLPEKTLNEVMGSLLRPHPIVVKKPRGTKVKKGDLFKMNQNFKFQKHRINLNSIQITLSEKERSTTTQQIQKDRKTQIQAAIVRIMKARRTLKHTELMSVAFKQLQFDADAKQIKKQIANLINKDYIERDPDDSTIYLYKA